MRGHCIQTRKESLLAPNKYLKDKVLITVNDNKVSQESIKCKIEKNMSLNNKRVGGN